MDSHPAHPQHKFVSFVLLIVLLLVIPVITIMFGQMTRQQIKADVACKKPEVPDPADCVGGQWKLYKNEDGCVRFSCQLEQ